MKKKFILFCVIIFSIMGCVDTIYTDTPMKDVEITYLTAPVTKATVEFDADNVFESAAFYDVKSFDYASSTSEVYIAPSVVSCTDKTNHIWKSTTSYYWPKDGGMLSFFSWSLNKNSLEFVCDPSLDPTITKDKGVSLVGFSSLSNDDFMVAEPALDKTANEQVYHSVSGVTAGVPTLFKHKTAKVSIKTKTKDDYTGDPYKHTFTITEINFVDVKTTGDFVQSLGGWQNLKTSATSGSAVDNYFKGSQVSKYNNGVAQDVVSTGSTLILPQQPTTGVEKLQIKYTVSREYVDNGVTKTKSTDYVADIDLNELLGGSQVSMGKNYVFTIIFSLNEIFWDPAVVEWDVLGKECEING